MPSSRVPSSQINPLLFHFRNILTQSFGQKKNLGDFLVFCFRHGFSLYIIGLTFFTGKRKKKRRYIESIEIEREPTGRKLCVKMGRRRAEGN